MPLSVFRGQRRPGATWTSKDRLLALALHAYEADLCSGCGQPMDDSMSEGAEDAYTVPAPHRCHGCTALYRGMEEYEDASVPQALRFHVALREGVRRT